MTLQKAEFGRWKAEYDGETTVPPSAFRLPPCVAALLFGGLLVLAGCNDRVSPGAAPPVSSSSAAGVRNGAQEPAAIAAPVEIKRTTIRDITFDTIKFDMKKEEPFLRSMLTPAIAKLHDAKIRVRGYILPSFQQTGLTQFVLVRDNMECCFGPGAALYDCIVVDMNSGKTADYTTRPVAVEGQFSIREVKGPDDKHLAIYHLQADKVR